MFDTNHKLSSDRDAMSDLALHFLNKMKIMVVKEIEREDIEFICKVRAAAAGRKTHFSSVSRGYIFYFMLVFLKA